MVYLTLIATCGLSASLATLMKVSCSTTNLLRHRGWTNEFIILLYELRQILVGLFTDVNGLKAMPSQRSGK